MQECVTALVVNPVMVDTKVIILKQATTWQTHHFLTGASFGRWMARDKVNITGVMSLGIGFHESCVILCLLCA